MPGVPEYFGIDPQGIRTHPVDALVQELVKSMVYVVCDSCGCVGVRIRSSGACGCTQHPAYIQNHVYHCQVCGSKLRVTGIREYDHVIVKGGEQGA